MKLKSTLPAVLLAAVWSMSAGTYAADADKAPAEQSAAKPMKPHSHMEEKTGMAPSRKSAETVPASEEKSDKSKAEKDKSKHLHPRDSK